jgi:hypothetical protein
MVAAEAGVRRAALRASARRGLAAAPLRAGSRSQLVRLRDAVLGAGGRGIDEVFALLEAANALKLPVWVREEDGVLLESYARGIRKIDDWLRAREAEPG